MFAAIPACLLARPAGAVTLEEAPPAVAPPAALTPPEQQISETYARCNPSVVNIFDITLSGRIPTGPAAVESAEGNGSGFVWDTAGHVLTNYHVLANVLNGSAGKLQPMAKVAIVYLLGPDGLQQAFDGLLVGADKARDLAVLKVAAPAALLRPLPLAESSTLRIGQTVLAIGNPFGLEHTLTTGVISALGRGFQSQTGSTIGGGIQTDCALNPGNSGGPLLDISGRVIGVSTAIFTNTGTSAGVGFGIPANIAAKVVPQLIANGRVRRASLGVQPAPDPVARALKVSQGVLIQTLDPGGPADKAGLLATRRGLSGIVTGDVIVRVGSSKVRSVFDLSAALDEAEVGDTVEVEVVRNAQTVAVSVTLAAENE